MRISDWSSDVCSSDLIDDLDTPRIATSGALMIGVNAVPPMPPSEEIEKQPPLICAGPSLPSRALPASSPVPAATSLKIGREAWRERVCQSVTRSVVAVYLIKQTRNTDKSHEK